MTRKGAVCTPWALAHSQDELLFSLFVKFNFMEVDVVMFPGVLIEMPTKSQNVKQ